MAGQSTSCKDLWSQISPWDLGPRVWMPRSNSYPPKARSMMNWSKLNLEEEGKETQPIPKASLSDDYKHFLIFWRKSGMFLLRYMLRWGYLIHSLSHVNLISEKELGRQTGLKELRVKVRGIDQSRDFKVVGCCFYQAYLAPDLAS